MKSVYHTSSPQQTTALGATLGKTLKAGDIVLLFGDLGAGKTHFTKGIAEGLGILQLIKSPTYAYVNNYPLPDDLTLHHYDLYRLEAGADFTSLGLEETFHDSKAINVVEWADRLGDKLPSRFIRIDIGEAEAGRTITIDFAYPTRATQAVVEDFWNEWKTPLHVREHCRQVARVGKQLAEAYADAGEIIDLNLVITACLLHDVCRVCDFKTMEREHFSEDITEAKWQRWMDLRAEYAGRHHADIAFDFLNQRGFTETAEAVRLHKSSSLVTTPEAYDTLEKKIVYYADKRVKHTEIVSLAERFEDGRKRYDPYNDEARKAFFVDVEQQNHEFEKTLFAPLSIRPEQIV